MVFLRPDIFKPMKYILVSATADESICKQFLDDADMDSHQCKQAKYKGKLLQYPGRSMSRSSIASDEGVVSVSYTHLPGLLSDRNKGTGHSVCSKTFLLNRKGPGCWFPGLFYFQFHIAEILSFQNNLPGTVLASNGTLGFIGILRFHRHHPDKGFPNRDIPPHGFPISYHRLKQPVTPPVPVRRPCR